LDGGREKIKTNNSVELYNLKSDIGERNNLCNTETVIRNELLDDLLKWMKKTEAAVPYQRNADYKQFN
jgi:hypothetical protein